MTEILEQVQGANYSETHEQLISLSHAGSPDTVPVEITPTVTGEAASASEAAQPTAGFSPAELIQLEMARRGFLGKVAKGAGMLGVKYLPEFTAFNIATAYMAHRYVDDHYPKGDPMMYWESPYDHERHSEVVLFFPGTGDLQYSKEAAELHQDQSLKHTPLAVVTYGHGKVDEDQLVDIATKKLARRRPEFISFLGRSIGGPVGLKVSLRVADNLGIMVRRIGMTSSPFDPGDANFGKFGTLLDHYAPNFDWLDEYAKVWTAGWQQVQEHGFWHIPSNIERASRTVEGGDNPVGLRYQFRMLDNVHLNSPDVNDLLRRVTDPEVTSGKYVSGQHPGEDQTVHDANSYNKYDALLVKHGIRFDWLRGKFDGHAVWGPSVKALGPWLEKTNSPLKVLASK